MASSRASLVDSLEWNQCKMSALNPWLKARVRKFHGSAPPHGGRPNERDTTETFSSLGSNAGGQVTGASSCFWECLEIWAWVISTILDRGPWMSCYRLGCMWKYICPCRLWRGEGLKRSTYWACCILILMPVSCWTTQASRDLSSMCCGKGESCGGGCFSFR